MKKHLSLILKILAVCIVLSLILIAVFSYLKSQKNNGITNEKKVQNDTVKQLTPQELTQNYKSNVVNVLSGFSGDYQDVRNKLVEISGVPADLKNLHFDIVVAFDYLIFKDDKESAKQRLEKIYTDYDWLKQPLELVIQSIK